MKENYRKNFKGTQWVWNNLLNPAVKVAAPFVGMAVGAKTKTPEVAQATTNILGSMSRSGRVLNLTDLFGKGVKTKVM